MNAELLGQSLAEGCFACSRGPVKQDNPIPADQLIVDMSVSKQQSTGGILQQTQLDLGVKH